MHQLAILTNNIEILKFKKIKRSLAQKHEIKGAS